MVVDPGLLTTIQDAGRAGYGHLGVAAAGAADPLALIAANALAGNDRHAPAIEMTLSGATFDVLDDCRIGLAGADMEARVGPPARSLRVAASAALARGSRLSFGTAVDGARTYLAIAGGIRADVVLGSASTDPVAGFGGLAGRPLRAGDRIAIDRQGGVRASATARRHALDPAAVDAGHEHTWPVGVPGSGVATLPGPRELAIVPGPHADRLPGAVSAALARTTWSVTHRSDRVGIRLAGEPIGAVDVPDLVSIPMLPGAVEIPPDGQPIVLMPDAPSVGGYPVPAVVASVDRAVTGQLRPGDEVRFRPIDVRTARAWRRDLDARVEAAIGRLGADG